MSRLTVAGTPTAAQAEDVTYIIGGRWAVDGAERPIARPGAVIDG